MSLRIVAGNDDVHFAGGPTKGIDTRGRGRWRQIFRRIFHYKGNANRTNQLDVTAMSKECHVDLTLRFCVKITVFTNRRHLGTEFATFERMLQRRRVWGVWTGREEAWGYVG
jgi:hypothetical protein